MKRFFLSLLIVFSLLNACSESSNHATEQTLAPADFQQHMLAHNGILLDVRTPEEFTTEHLNNAINVDYKSSDFKDQLEKLDKTKPYYVYCKAGVRSEKATDLMQEMGFTQVYHMDGGIDAWKEQGLPITKQ